MNRLFVFLIIGFIIGFPQAYGKSAEIKADTVVKVFGKVVNSNTKDPISANITYEKLPYGDDMGISQSKLESGDYQMFMLKSGDYKVKVSAPGYNTYSAQITIDQLNSSGEFERDFELRPEGTDEIIRLENLIFATGKATISSESYQELDGLAKMMNERPAINVQLEGHTDFAGNADANLQLSQERVEEVKKYLVKNGVKKNRILLKAFGGTQPLSRDRSQEGRRMNRRVEVRVIE